MVGSHTSVRPSASRFWIALLAILAVVATACGGEDVNTAPTMDRSAEDQLADLAPPSDDADAAAPAVDDAAPADDVDAATDADPADGAPDAGDDAATDDKMADIMEDALAAAGIDAPVTNGGPTAAVLAFAIENSESVTYTFEQGMSMEMSFFGIEMNATPTEAFITGSVDGDKNYVRVDMGVFMQSMLDSMSTLGEEPTADDLAGIDFSSLIMESWTDGTTQVLDMSQFVNSMAATDPAAAAELAPFADGPVKLDVATLAQANGIDPSTLLTQLETGAQYTDPAELFNALRAIDAVSEVGTDVVNGDAVTVYVAAMSLTQYTDALGVDVTDQMGGLGDLGIDPNDPSMADMMDALDSIPVTVTTMIDGDDQVRRLDILIDIAPVFDSLIGAFMGTGDDVDAEQMAALFGDMEIIAKMETWQIFDNYGEPVDIVLPDAEDRTAELVELFDLE